MTPQQRIALVRRLHDSNKQIVLATTGGGSLAISDLLTEPGATKTLLEAHVPYSFEALTRFLGQAPQQACSTQTARCLAMACFKRGQQAAENAARIHVIPVDDDAAAARSNETGFRRHFAGLDNVIDLFGSAAQEHSISYRQKKWCKQLIGIGCTASLVSNRPKKGEHRFHIAVQSHDSTSVFSLVLKKGARTRQEEERLVADCLLKYLAEAAGIPFEFSIPLIEEERFTSEQTVVDDPWIELLFGDAAAVLSVDGKPIFTKKNADVGAPILSEQRPFSPEVEYMHNIFAGSFAPMHQGHVRMIELAQKRLSGKITLEISICNVDKAPLDYLEIEHRLRQIEQMIPGQAVWLTRTTRFIDKSLLFRGSTFLIGADTLKRIGDLKYYASNHSILMEVLRIITYCGCRFLVFARPVHGTVEKLQTMVIPDILRTLCEEVDEEEFCEDISSSAIREGLENKSFSSVQQTVGKLGKLVEQ